MFFEQLLLPQIPKAQKRQASLQCHFAFLGPTNVKAALGMLIKLTLGDDGQKEYSGIF